MLCVYVLSTSYSLISARFLNLYFHSIWMACIICFSYCVDSWVEKPVTGDRLWQAPQVVTRLTYKWLNNCYSETLWQRQNLNQEPLQPQLTLARLATQATLVNCRRAALGALCLDSMKASPPILSHPSVSLVASFQCWEKMCFSALLPIIHWALCLINVSTFALLLPIDYL